MPPSMRLWAGKGGEMVDPVAYRWTYPPPPGRDAIWHFGPDWPLRRDEHGNKPISVEPLFVAPPTHLPPPNPEWRAGRDPLLDHPSLSDLAVGKAVYLTRLYGDGRGNYVGATRETMSRCAIAHVGHLVTIDGQRVLELTGYLTVPRRTKEEAPS